MTQKDKVKELVGRGLNSYHTKSLQQIDRIEKKNKEQNHKISILTNELDNDYLTKTEEGSVVSLEHSKEGMVYLDELQGNTLVNYCTDGSKEMILNGDIDVEGTFVTTTEGVDGGKIDVMCEGNTLVNAWTLVDENPYNPNISSNLTSKVTVDQSKTYCKITINEDLSPVEGNKWIVFRAYPKQHCRDMIKLNTTYTLIFNLDYNFNLNSNISVSIANNVHHHFVRNKSFMPKKGLNKVVITTVSEEPENRRGQHIYIGFPNFLSTDVIGKYFKFSDFYMLEGNWSNKEIPPYFVGMKSVGQDDVNGHKIEILSQSSYPNLIQKSKNLSGNRIGSDTSNHNGVQYLIEDNVEFARVSANKQDFSNFYWWLQTVEPRKKGETYTISYDYRCTSDWSGYWYPSESYSGSFFPSTNGEWRRMKITRTVTSGDAKGDMLFGVAIRGTETGNYIDIKNVKMEKGTNNSKWIPSVMDEEFLLAKYSNKKEILMNEPLRSLPNGIKDRMVKIGGKYFIERNLYGITLNGNSNENWTIGFTNFGTPIFSWNKTGINIYKSDSYYSVLSDRFIYARQYSQTETNYKCIYVYNYGDANEQSIRIQYPLNSVEEFRNYLSANPIDVIIRLETPTYEPLEIEPTLNTYNDITHISNNSIIHCNMKIKNSGYNVIIKPSTLYTVALDTNKSGTIGLNLGGAKITTTNNVTTITTPATLTDDSLRLYGKGIKGSKVRLLEGDKTNWIPSHFEGMKSSFEDKFDDTDNTYKMEILMNNENLFDITKLQDDSTEHHIAKKNNANGFTLTRKNTGSGWNYSTWELPFKLKANTKYTISCKINKSNINSKPCCRLFDFTLQKDYAMLYSSGKYEFTTPINGYERIKLLLYSSIDNVTINEGDTVDFNDIKISEVKNGDFVNHQSNKIQFSSIEPLRKTRDAWDRFVFVDGKLMIERNCIEFVFDGSEDEGWSNSYQRFNKYYVMRCIPSVKIKSSWDYRSRIKSSHFPSIGAYIYAESDMDKYIKGISSDDNNIIMIGVPNYMFSNLNEGKEYLKNNPLRVVTERKEPIYEEIPHELQKIILEGYENGTLFIDTNIPPTSTVTYAGETPIVKATKLNKTEVLSNTEDINDNIIPYLMDMDYRVVCLQLQSENINDGVSMARLFGGAYEMLQRDIQSKRYSVDEYRHRLDAYLDANKIAEEEYNKLGDMLNE